jgi:hypothetical protein
MLSGDGRELPSSLVRAMAVVVAGVGVEDIAGADNVVRPGDGRVTHHSEILFLSTFSGASDR